MDIGDLLFFRFGVVVIEYVGYGVYVQVVYVLVFDLVGCVIDQEFVYFGVVKVVDQCVLVVVKVFFGIGVFVELSVIEFGQVVGVGWEVGWYLVQQQIQVCVMYGFDEVGEVFGWVEMGVGCVQVQCLVVLGVVEGMFVDGYQLYVCEVQVGCIGGQLFGQFVLSGKFVGYVVVLGCGMYFVDVDWGVVLVGVFVLVWQWCGFGQGCYDVGCVRLQLGVVGIGVGFEWQQLVVVVDDFEFVEIVFGCMWYEDFLYIGLVLQLYWVVLFILVVEVVDDVDVLCVWCLGCEVYVVYVVVLYDMCV